MLKLSEKEVCEIIDYLKERISQSELSIGQRIDIKDKALLEQLVFDKSQMETKGYAVIRDDIIDILCYLDISALSFAGVCLNGTMAFADLSLTNAVIDPQKVYNLDMRNGRFPLDFKGMSFNHVMIDKSDFKESKGVTIKLSMVDGNLSDGVYPFMFINDIDENFNGYIDCSGSDFSEASMDIDVFLGMQHHNEEDIKNGKTSVYEKYGIKSDLATMEGLDYAYHRKALARRKIDFGDNNSNVLLARTMIDTAVNASKEKIKCNKKIS